MKILKRYGWGILFSFLVFTSCNKDTKFLDKPDLNAYGEDEVWEDINLSQNYVNAIYRALPYLYSDNQIVPSIMGLSAASDEGYSTFNYEDVYFWNRGAITPDDIGMDAWSDYYKLIRDCNIFFANVSKIEGDESQIDRLNGEVKFLRAFSYFMLLSRYGGVPLITKVYTLEDTDFEVSRSGYDDVLGFIVDELNEAGSLLPLEYTGDDLGRITKGAAMAIKSRALLYAASELNNPGHDMQKWQEAADAAKDLIDLADGGQYELLQGEDYTAIFLDKFNSEAILSFGMNADINPYTGDYGTILNTYLGPNGYHGWSAYTPSQNMVDAFEMNNGKEIGDPLSGYDPQDPYVNRDPRFYADILYNGAAFRGREVETFEGGLDSPQSPVENWNASLTGYNWRKYTDESQPLSENHGNSQNFVVARLAEIYLNYAEAEAELGNDNIARDYVNKVRTRTSVDMPPIDDNISGSDLMDRIRHERRIELCMEGHRFFDVRRWKIASNTENVPIQRVLIKKTGSGLEYQYLDFQERTFKDAEYLFPIPTYEMRRNNSLEQNPDY